MQQQFVLNKIKFKNKSKANRLIFMALSIDVAYTSKTIIKNGMQI